uniref:Uncharacterized protein n=1 Tax=Rhizophora mucronata TaxID=61149 RepID=A0A2P2QBA7_RHIMU
MFCRRLLLFPFCTQSSLKFHSNPDIGIDVVVHIITQDVKCSTWYRKISLENSTKTLMQPDCSLQ